MHVAPPIVKASERLLLDIEQAVRGFAHYHKHSLGVSLRAQAFGVAHLANRAWRQRSLQAERVEQLVWAVDDIKISLQLGSQLRAFASLAQYEALARVARDLGKQVGGWHRQLHPKGQNAPAGAPGQRAQILSTRAASHEGARS